MNKGKNEGAAVLDAEAFKEQAARWKDMRVAFSKIGHDINNLFTPMLLGAGMMADEPLSELGRESLDAINQTLRRAAASVEKLLLFARGSKGGKPCVDPAGVTLDLVEKMKAEVRGLRPVVREGVGSGPIRCSREAWQSAVKEIILNASEAAPGGEVVLEIFPPSDAAEWRFLVHDTGCGMTQEVVGKVFHPGFTHGKGHNRAGMGMAVVMGIIADAGGVVEIESGSGSGTTITVRMPVVAAA